MRRLRVSHQAESDIEAALAWTRQEFGERKYAQYRVLIRLALLDVARDPSVARSRPELHRNAGTFHIGRRGKRARHFLLIRVTDDGVVGVGRLLHDAMDLPSHLPATYEP